MAWELPLIIYSLVGFCCAAALSIGAWMCGNVCVCTCVCVCPFIHCCFPSRSRAWERKHTTSSGGEICFVGEFKLQCLSSCAATPCVFERSMYLCTSVAVCDGVFKYVSGCLHGPHCVCVGCCVWLSWGCVSFDHDSRMEEQITFQCRSNRKALSGWQTSPTNLISFSFHDKNPATRSCERRWIGFDCKYNAS